MRLSAGTLSQTCVLRLPHQPLTHQLALRGLYSCEHRFQAGCSSGSYCDGVTLQSSSKVSGPGKPHSLVPGLPHPDRPYLPSSHLSPS